MTAKEDHDAIVRFTEASEGRERRIRNLEERLDLYVTKTEFAPVRLLVYGFTGTILTGVVVAGISALSRYLGL